MIRFIMTKLAFNLAFYAQNLRISRTIGGGPAENHFRCYSSMVIALVGRNPGIYEQVQIPENFFLMTCMRHFIRIDERVLTFNNHFRFIINCKTVCDAHLHCIF